MESQAALDIQQYQEQIARDGFGIVRKVISTELVEVLRAAIDVIPTGEEVRRRKNVYGVRNLLEMSPACRELAASSEIRSLVTPVLGDKCFAVRSTFFDKVPGANWNLRWHQDSVISVKERIETPGFYAWAIKVGVQQVRPPVEVLTNMLAIRVHLDDCHCSNGALRILKGSHTRRWPREEMALAKTQHEMVTCEVPVGGVLAMRPLALHASSASELPLHRRVIHLEFACQDLPGGLEWKNRILPV